MVIIIISTPTATMTMTTAARQQSQWQRHYHVAYSKRPKNCRMDHQKQASHFVRILQVASYSYHQSYHRYLIQERKGPEGGTQDPVDFAKPASIRLSRSNAGDKRQRKFGVPTERPTRFICSIGDRPAGTEQTTNEELRLELDGTRYEWCDGREREVSCNNRDWTVVCILVRVCDGPGGHGRGQRRIPTDCVIDGVGKRETAMRHTKSSEGSITKRTRQRPTPILRRHQGRHTLYIEYRTCLFSTKLFNLSFELPCVGKATVAISLLLSLLCSPFCISLV